MSKYGYRFYGHLFNVLFVAWLILSWFTLSHLLFFSSLIITGLGNIAIIQVLKRHYLPSVKKEQGWPYDPQPGYLSGGESSE